ncbi:MAG: PQQ-binding-like beta-propeller repeat protein, partial [Methanosarcinales archaeon]
LSVNISIFSGYALLKAIELMKLDRILKQYIKQYTTTQQLKNTDKKKKKKKSKTYASQPKISAIKIIAILYPILFLFLIFVALSVYANISVSQNEPEIISRDWYDGLLFLKAHTPFVNNNPLQAYENTYAEYGVMSWWDYGNWIVYVGNRPAVSNNFQVGINDAAQFFTSEGLDGTAILDKRKVRYIIVDTAMGYGYRDRLGGKYESIAKIAGKDISDYYYSFFMPTPHGTEGVVYIKRLLLNYKYYNTTYAKLYYFDASSATTSLMDNVNGIGHYRLIYESKNTDTELTEIKKVKIFEYVKGAIITGHTYPNVYVEVFIPIKTNRNRVFNYTIGTQSDQSGIFNITVPYATKNHPYNTTPIDNWTISINGIASKKVVVTEDDIMHGNIIEVGDIMPKININFTSPYTLNLTLNNVWKFNTSKVIISTPVLQYKTIYLCSDLLYAINANNGREVWKYEPEQNDIFSASPLIENGILYVSSLKGYVYAIRADDGKILWKKDLTKSILGKVIDNKILSSPIIHDNILYVGSNNHNLYALDAKTGAILWKYQLDSEIVAHPTISNNTMYLTSYNGTIYAINLLNKVLEWEQPIEEKIWSSPVFANNTVFFGTRNNSVYALNATTGEILWN